MKPRRGVIYVPFDFQEEAQNEFKKLGIKASWCKTDLRYEKCSIPSNAVDATGKHVKDHPEWKVELK